MNNGWIKLCRKFLYWRCFKDSHCVHLFLYLLVNASSADCNCGEIELKRGQVITGRKRISDDTGISEQTVRTCLNKLKRGGEISVSSTNRFSIITVVNYDSYSIGDKESCLPKCISAEKKQIEKERIDYEKLRIFFNETMRDTQIPSIEKMTEKRKVQINARCREYGKQAIFDVINKAASSPFLNGGGTNAWVACFDWMFRPNNFPKILEGNYDKKEEYGIFEQRGKTERRGTEVQATSAEDYETTF